MAYTDTTQSYYDAVSSNTPLVDLLFIDSTNCKLPQAAAILLLPDQDYVWSVRAYDLASGLPVGSNYGYATPFIFRVTQNGADTAPHLFYKRSAASCPFDGFESNNLDMDGWKYFRGFHFSVPNQAYPSGSRLDGVKLTAQSKNGFTIMAAGPTDPFFSNIPVVPPGGGNYSLKIGDALTNDNNDVDLMQKTFTVTPDNAIFFIKYAYVAESGKHARFDDAGFRLLVRKKGVVDDISNLIKYMRVFGDERFPGFSVIPYSPHTWNLVGKSWDCIKIDLTKYIGQTVVLELYSLDCQGLIHSGYVYVDFCVQDLLDPSFTAQTDYCINLHNGWVGQLC